MQDSGLQQTMPATFFSLNTESFLLSENVGFGFRTFSTFSGQILSHLCEMDDSLLHKTVCLQCPHHICVIYEGQPM